MPPRMVSLAILGLWLATLAWLWQRDAATMQHAPAWTFDLGDEATSHNYSWIALVDHEEVAHMVAGLRGNAQGRFELSGTLSFNRPVKLHGRHARVVFGRCHFTARGVLH